MNLKGFLYLVLLDIEGRNKFLLQSSWKAFSFLVTLLLEQKIFKRDFCEVSILSNFLQSLKIEPV